MSVDDAQMSLLYGITPQQIGGAAQMHPSYRRTYRWQNNPETILLNDFDKLLVYLFSEENDTSISYR